MEKEQSVSRDHKKRMRTYRFVDVNAQHGRRAIQRILICVSAAVFCYGMWHVVSYYLDFLNTKKTSADLRQTYYSNENQNPVVISAPVTELPSPTEMPLLITPAPTIMRSVVEAFSENRSTVAPVITLQPQSYADNPYGSISEKFKKLRRQNKDIVGWLNIEGILDEAVVQRNNEYYLRRDYLGYHNVNGAIFLDERCSLIKERPYTLMLFAHNMKNGSMFGALRNYENIGFYKNNPLVTFDTIFEDGKYVIFAVSTVSLKWQDIQYVDFNALLSDDAAKRQESIYALKRNSTIITGIDVNAEDQLLLLITCIGNNEQRRVVAARRIRGNETEEAVLRTVQSIAYSRY